MAQHHIPISGAQGAGKSTLLDELERRGYTVDRFKVSRAVQAQLGWDSLDRVLESAETMMEFQEAVFQQKYANDRALHFQSNVYTLTERSFADIIAYSMTWMWKLVDRRAITLDDAMSWVHQYTVKCADAQAELYSGIIMLPMMDHIVFESDPHRAKKEDVEAVYENMRRFTENPSFITVPKLVITAKTVEERADQVEAFMRKL